MRRSTPDSDLSHERFTAGENQEILLQKQDCIQGATTVFQNIFAILRNTGFCLQHCRQKEKAYMRK